MTIQNWPVSEQPREKLLTLGPRFLSDAELIAILLQTGIRGKTAIDMARELLSEFGGLKPFLTAKSIKKNGFGKAKLSMLQAAIELGRRFLEEPLPSGDILKSSIVTKSFLSSRLKHYKHEVFAAIFLDNQNRVICFEELFHGTLNEANVYPREVVKKALSHNAAKIIFAHNHPSGEAMPSQADQNLTRVLKEALLLVDIRVIDHIIVGRECMSFVELGLL